MNPQPGSVRAQFAASVESLIMQVNSDTVLQARAAVLAEAYRLRTSIQVNSVKAHIGLCGDDPVSHDAKAAFNERIDALLGQCRQYTDDLEAAGHALGDTARTYGYTEDEITASFTAS